MRRPSTSPRLLVPSGVEGFVGATTADGGNGGHELAFGCDHLGFGRRGLLLEPLQLGMRQAVMNEVAEEQVKTAQEALQLAKQRYKLGLGTVMEVTQSQVALTTAQTKLAEAQYDYKIAEVTLSYAAGGSTQLQIDPTIR